MYIVYKNKKMWYDSFAIVAMRHLNLSKKRSNDTYIVHVIMKATISLAQLIEIIQACKIHDSITKIYKK